jgi:hypothetical protein
MIYAPRALRHFSLAAIEGRAEMASAVSLSARPHSVAHPHSVAKAPKAVPMNPPSRPVRPARPRTVVRLWLPLTLVFLLLAPIALLLAPLICLAPRPYRDRPLATVLGVGQLLLSLGGTVVDVDTPEALVRIRIF